MTTERKLVHYVRTADYEGKPDYGDFRLRLVRAMELAVLLNGYRTLDEKDAESLRKLYEIVHDLHREVPTLTLWCVVKHYNRTEEDIKFKRWEPTVWTAHLTKEQAEAFAPATEEHYRRPRDGEHYDRFKAERVECDVTDIINPDLTAAEYVAGLSTRP